MCTSPTRSAQFWGALPAADTHGIQTREVSKSPMPTESKASKQAFSDNLLYKQFRVLITLVLGPFGIITSKVCLRA